MIEFSKKKKKEALNAGLTMEELALADLVCAGWKEWDAYYAMGLYKPAFSEDKNIQLFKRRIEKAEYKVYIAEKQKALDKLKSAAKTPKKSRTVNKTIDNVNASTLSKEELLGQLLEAANAVKIDDPKKYADILSKYADLQKMKQDDIKTEDNTVHFYLPITCTKCSLYMTAKKQKRKEG